LKKRIVICSVFAVLVIIGLVCWIMQLSQGLQLTNLNNYNTWGLYIIGFMLFTGIAAGSLLFTSAAWLLPGLAEFRPYTRISAFTGAIGSVVAAGLFIIVDIGNPERAWFIVTRLHITSPMFWDTVILAAYVIIGIIYTRQLLLVKAGKREEKSLRPISIIAFCAGLLVMVTSFVFALQVARPLWNNPVQPLSFLAAALVAALALLSIILLALNSSGYITISRESLARIGRWAGAALVFELCVVLGEIILGAYAGAGEASRVVVWLTSGAGAPFFWLELIAIILGIVLLFNRSLCAPLGSPVALVAVFLVKYNLLQAQLLNPLLNYAGPPGYSGVTAGAYLPSLIEVGVSLGVIALGCLLVLLGLSKLKLGNS
jgi:molybdopterin-containing oxidoreductase family membrane subunit